MLVNTHHHFLQCVRVVMVDTTQKNRRQVARCVRLEPSVTQRHLLAVSSAHQDTTRLQVRRVALPVHDSLPPTVYASHRRQLLAF